jgi:hypothetical protein
VANVLSDDMSVLLNQRSARVWGEVPMAAVGIVAHASELRHLSKDVDADG